ncbi:RNA 2'-phosphotransferase [Nostoc sp. KVJ3]|uniref:RNA 2'-phosphotransferase n=1 Tax=Nostoc sp. KVJ3 TaxID=457945 RepID=UPI0022372DBF|nr:RNA 2'-phosphotransferase [Nostoc sp. KVJ3]MCW5315117.1 RNA 2'-phosphotransferase [Nostoc sp. KVJ3]
MSDPRPIKISKYLSKYLRHTPDAIGIKLAPGGWVAVDELINACAKNKFPITRQELQAVVESSDKQRFALDSTGTLIRANQGHSVEVDLQLEPAVPPDELYHGTGHKSVDSILETGLRKMSRHHVHLSKDIATAQTVGARHGKAVVFAVSATAMHQAGYIFYCSDNGVWLVDRVPPEYLQKI